MPEISKVITQNFKMRYCKFGTGERTLVILPGLSIQSVMDSAYTIEAEYKLMQKDFTIYVFDRRENLPDPYSIYDMARDTAEAIKSLGLDKVSIFGASQGGMIAMVIAIEYPELVEKLVLGSTSPHVKDAQADVLKKWIELAKAKDAHSLYQRFAREIYPNDIYSEYEEFFNDASNSVTASDLERFVILASAIIDFDISAELKRIKCPTLAIGVFDDEVLDSDSTMEIAENLDYMPDFKLFMYVGYGHAAFDTAPDYRKRIYDFLIK